MGRGAKGSQNSFLDGWILFESTVLEKEIVNAQPLQDGCHGIAGKGSTPCYISKNDYFGYKKICLEKQMSLKRGEIY